MIGRYCFDENVLDAGMDVFETKELFGSGAAAERLTIVSKKFRTLVELHQWKGLQFIPVLRERYKR